MEKVRPHFLFDSVILIDFWNGAPQAVETFKEFEPVSISELSWIEFMVGISDKDWDKAQLFLENLHQHKLTEEIKSRAAKFRRDVKLKFVDAVIYATAQEYGLTLITRNSKDFAKMPGAIIPYKLLSSS